MCWILYKQQGIYRIYIGNIWKKLLQDQNLCSLKMKVSENQEIRFSGFWIGSFKECQKGPKNIFLNVSSNYFFVEYARRQLNFD
jgi:hypothetical protein